MEDMATGEIRLSILWEWVHKGAMPSERFAQLLEEEYGKLQHADNRDVHDDSKRTTLPIARMIVERYVREPAKLPWFIDLLNAALGTDDLAEATRRVDRLAEVFRDQGVRVTSLHALSSAPGRS
jgi:malate synthase